jgi:hypothetical protein
MMETDHLHTPFSLPLANIINRLARNMVTIEISAINIFVNGFIDLSSFLPILIISQRPTRTEMTKAHKLKVEKQWRRSEDV